MEDNQASDVEQVGDQFRGDAEGEKMKEENDPTKYLARSAVVIAGVRAGGTFLAHCLSNHRQIFCDRAESLHHSSVWHRNIKPYNPHLLHCLLHMQGYHVSMCKLTHGQAFGQHVWKYIKTHKPAIIWLRRENVIRQSVSLLINRAARGGKVNRPQHSFKDAGPLTIGLSAEAILKQARGLQKRDERARKLIARFPDVMRITYEDITQDKKPDRVPVKMARQICSFLGVRYEMLRCDLVRVNPQPLSELIRDWATVGPKLRASEFGACLEDGHG
jgi:hypothetical protein